MKKKQKGHVFICPDICKTLIHSSINQSIEIHCRRLQFADHDDQELIPAWATEKLDT